MDICLEATLSVSPNAVLVEVSDLAGYPAWHGMVKRVEADGDGWLVDLGGKIGPFSHTKRVRLVQVPPEETVPGLVRFVRAEGDGQEHGQWELEAQVSPVTGAGPCTLSFRLVYDSSSPLSGLLELLLRAEVKRSAERLGKLLTDTK